MSGASISGISSQTFDALAASSVESTSEAAASSVRQQAVDGAVQTQDAMNLNTAVRGAHLPVEGPETISWNPGEKEEGILRAESAKTDDVATFIENVKNAVDALKQSDPAFAQELGDNSPYSNGNVVDKYLTNIFGDVEKQTKVDAVVAEMGELRTKIDALPPGPLTPEEAAMRLRMQELDTQRIDLLSQW